MFSTRRRGKKRVSIVGVSNVMIQVQGAKIRASDRRDSPITPPNWAAVRAVAERKR